jgi:hypothetical protein
MGLTLAGYAGVKPNEQFLNPSFGRQRLENMPRQKLATPMRCLYT